MLALRVYTTQSYGRINNPLRQDPPERPHPFAATTYFISEAIKKLRAVATDRQDAHQDWRGMKDLGLSAEFFAHGGTEYAPMSTSASRTWPATARSARARWSSSSSPCRAAPTSRGSVFKFLSVYESEAEVLYPPLTYLRSKGTATEVIGGHTMLVATVEPIFPS